MAKARKEGKPKRKP